MDLLEFIDNDAFAVVLSKLCSDNKHSGRDVANLRAALGVNHSQLVNDKLYLSTIHIERSDITNENLRTLSGAGSYILHDLPNITDLTPIANAESYHLAWMPGISDLQLLLERNHTYCRAWIMLLT